MKISHILLFGTNSFGIGLLAPVLSLVLLSHGASMETLSLCIGIFAAMVVLLELPSGILGFMDSSYTFLLILAISIQLILVLLTACFVRETARENITCSPMLTFKNQLHALYSSLRHSLPVIVITMMAAAVGMVLCTVEVYWQPTLKIFLPERLGWLFGVVTCLGYLGVTVGNKAMEAVMKLRRTILTPEKTWRLYWLLRFLLVICIAGLGFSRRTWLFLLLFVLVYAVLGAGNLIENTLFHKAVPSSQRASMMSLLSLSTRAGGLITSILGEVIVSGLSLSFIGVLLPLADAVIIGRIMVFFYCLTVSRYAAEP